METKLDALNNLPADKSFLAQTTQSDGSQTAQTDKENTLAMMWKYMTIHRRVQATEEAVEKVMNILNDVSEDVGQLKTVKSRLDELHNEQLKMAGEFDAVKSGGGLELNLEKVCMPVSPPSNLTIIRLSVCLYVFISTFVN